MSEIIASVYEYMEDTGHKNRAFLFIDEINCVSETLAPGHASVPSEQDFRQPCRCRRDGSSWRRGIRRNTIKSVREFDIVTLDRVGYLEIRPEVETSPGLRQTRHRLHGAVSCAIWGLTSRSGFTMCPGEECRRPTCYVTARGWEDLSCILYSYESLKRTRDRASFRRISPERSQWPGVFLSTTAGMRRRKRIRGWLIFSPESSRIHL